MSDQPKGGYENAPAICQSCNPRSPEVAQRISAMIQDQSPGLSVEHVGSTAVSECMGKGVVDLIIPYCEGQLETARNTLGDLGFQHQNTRDPFPEDRPMRVGSIEHEGDIFRLHIHGQ